jgi:hypothetical protein
MRYNSNDDFQSLFDIQIYETDPDQDIIVIFIPPSEKCPHMVSREHRLGPLPVRNEFGWISSQLKVEEQFCKLLLCIS